ncbi:MAG: PorP/SprF family type IX secretion system membrane protein [Chitinophagales bacterium]|nr:PorP/SprF family type IX secretion system membrane protein [Chitinophagales bacterium]MDW8418368.1 PorP/SprF family type IX secretion system membrane protein [Chitinophagales bacterium]
MWLCTLWAVGQLQAQDIHFSQFNFSPLNQNPANTNLFDGDFRFVANYKNQWPTVPVRFNTVSLSAEMNFFTLPNNDRVGGGALFYFDRAGDSRFQAINSSLSFSYIKAIGKRARHFIAAGFQTGLIHRSFRLDNLSFDNQWNGDLYDPTVPIDEIFTRTRLAFFDLGAGMSYRWRKDDRNQIHVGFAAMHLTQPNQSYFGNQSVKLNLRFTAHSRVQMMISKRMDIVPELLFQMQDTKYEVVYGAHTKYYFPMSKGHVLALNTGMYGRSAEAGWLLWGVDYDNLQVNMSYDVNFSGLRAASRYNGGFEVSVIYILTKLKNISGPVCPTLL